MNPSLLEPSLQNRSPNVGYSQRAGFMVGFFGGALASLLFNAMNIHQWRRFREDAVFLVAMVTAVLLGVGWHIHALHEAGPDASAWLRRGVSRFMGLGTWAIFALRHRAQYKAQEISEIAPKSPWPAALASIAFSVAVLSLAKVAWGRGP